MYVCLAYLTFVCILSNSSLPPCYPLPPHPFPASIPLLTVFPPNLPSLSPFFPLLPFHITLLLSMSSLLNPTSSSLYLIYPHAHPPSVTLSYYPRISPYSGHSSQRISPPTHSPPHTLTPRNHPHPHSLPVPTTLPTHSLFRAK